MAAGNGKMTPTEKRIYDLLSDGYPHLRQEVFKCLNDELQPLDNIHNYISRVRDHINPKGLDILLTIHKRNKYYRMVRLLASSNE